VLLLLSGLVTGRIPVCSSRTFRPSFGVAAPPKGSIAQVHRSGGDTGRSLGLVITEVVPPFGGAARRRRSR
jgi:hypothetical protein